MDLLPMPLRLETERLILTPEVAEDAGWFTELLNERGSETFTVAQGTARIAAMTDTLARTGIGALVLRSRRDGEALGYCALIVGRSTLDEPEIAFELLPRAHGQGLATEAARALLEAAWSTGRDRVWSTVRAWNAPSLRVLDKLDFHHDRRTTDEAGELIWLVRDRPRELTLPGLSRPAGRTHTEQDDTVSRASCHEPARPTMSLVNSAPARRQGDPVRNALSIAPRTVGVNADAVATEVAAR